MTTLVLLVAVATIQGQLSQAEISNARKAHVEFLERVELARPKPPYNDIHVERTQQGIRTSSDAYGSATIRFPDYIVAGYSSPLLFGERLLRSFQPKFPTDVGATKAALSMAGRLDVPLYWVMEPLQITADQVNADKSVDYGTISVRFVEKYFPGTSQPATFARISLDAMTGRLREYSTRSNITIGEFDARILPEQAIYIYYGMAAERFDAVTGTTIQHRLPSHRKRRWFEAVVSRPAWALELTTGVVPPSRYYIDAVTGGILDTGVGPRPEPGPWTITLPTEVVTLPADSPIYKELEPLIADWLGRLGYSPNHGPITIQTLDNRHFRVVIDNKYVFLWRLGESQFMLFRRPDILGALVTGGDMVSAAVIGHKLLPRAKAISGMPAPAMAKRQQAYVEKGRVLDTLCLLMEPEDHGSDNNFFHFDRSLVRFFGESVIEVVHFPSLQRTAAAEPQVTEQLKARFERRYREVPVHQMELTLLDVTAELGGDVADVLRDYFPTPKPVKAVTPVQYATQSAPMERWMWQTGNPQYPRIWSHPELDYLFWNNL